MPDDSNNSQPENHPLIARINELIQEGIGSGHASGKALLEYRVAEWPEDWGLSLQVLIYGDFQPPDADLRFPALRITVKHEKLENTVPRSALCVLRAIVEVDERSVPAIIDAIRRINVLLGAWSLVEWGKSACGWWCHIIHSAGNGAMSRWKHDEVERAISGIVDLPDRVRRKVDAALYWVREPRGFVLESHRRDVLKLYAGYWNAFECLVDAVNVLRPQQKPSKEEKQKRLDAFVAEREGRLTPADIQTCYQEIVNPGLKAKASYALEVCFGKEAQGCVRECFELEERPNRLYDIRNAINHGEIDAENPEELARIDGRLERLWMIVWQMFGWFIPFGVPVDTGGLQK